MWSKVYKVSHPRQQTQVFKADTLSPPCHSWVLQSVWFSFLAQKKIAIYILDPNIELSEEKFLFGAAFRTLQYSQYNCYL